MARQQRCAGRVQLALDHRAAAADGRAAPWPGPRSGRASPRPRGRARARPAPAPGHAAPAARSCRPCRPGGPARGRGPRRSPRSSRAAITSSQDLPVVTTPSQAPSPPSTTRSSRLARAKARAASSLWVWTRASCARAMRWPRPLSGQRMLSPPGGGVKSSGRRIVGQRRIDRDRGRALDRVVDAFQRHPAAGEARHGDAEQAVFQDLLHAGRVQHRHQRVDHGVLALVRRGAGFADMVVAQQHQHAAMLRRCRTGCRGGSRRRSGRRRGPWRTRSRTRRRSGSRRRGRPAACPSRRWRPGPR